MFMGFSAPHPFPMILRHVPDRAKTGGSGINSLLIRAARGATLFRTEISPMRVGRGAVINDYSP